MNATTLNVLQIKSFEAIQAIYICIINCVKMNLDQTLQSRFSLWGREGGRRVKKGNGIIMRNV